VVNVQHKLDAVPLCPGAANFAGFFHAALQESTVQQEMFRPVRSRRRHDQDVFSSLLVRRSLAFVVAATCEVVYVDLMVS